MTQSMWWCDIDIAFAWLCKCGLRIGITVATTCKCEFDIASEHSLIIVIGSQI